MIIIMYSFIKKKKNIGLKKQTGVKSLALPKSNIFSLHNLQTLLNQMKDQLTNACLLYPEQVGTVSFFCCFHQLSSSLLDTGGIITSTPNYGIVPQNNFISKRGQMHNVEPAKQKVAMIIRCCFDVNKQKNIFLLFWLVHATFYNLS